jgi:DNA-binding transcriptional regulator YiaG
MPNTNKCKELREKLNFSQSQFAEFTGLPLKTLQKWESGETQPNAAALLILNNLNNPVIAKHWSAK